MACGVKVLFTFLPLNAPLPPYLLQNGVILCLTKIHLAGMDEVMVTHGMTAA